MENLISISSCAAENQGDPKNCSVIRYTFAITRVCHDHKP
jgi:hypothetical protein